MDIFCCYFLIFHIMLQFSVQSTHSAKIRKDSTQATDLETSEDTTPNRDFRWSYFYFLEKKCTKICQGYGKPYGRMQGTLCRCYCPIIAPDWTLCSGTIPSCDNFCRALKFRLGGGCIHEPDECYCYCYPQEFYNASLVYSKPPDSPKPSKPFLLAHLKPTMHEIIYRNNKTEEESFPAPANRPLDSAENRPLTGVPPGTGSSLSGNEEQPQRPPIDPNPSVMVSLPNSEAVSSLGTTDSVDLPFNNEEQNVSYTFIDGTSPSSVLNVTQEVGSILNASNIVADPNGETDLLHHDSSVEILVTDVDESYHISEDIENMDVFDYIIHYDGFDYDTIINEYTDGDDILIEEEYSELFDPISRRGIISDKN